MKEQELLVNLISLSEYINKLDLDLKRLLKALFMQNTIRTEEYENIKRAVKASLSYVIEHY